MSKYDYTVEVLFETMRRISDNEHLRISRFDEELIDETIMQIIDEESVKANKSVPWVTLTVIVSVSLLVSNLFF